MLGTPQDVGRLFLRRGERRGADKAAKRAAWKPNPGPQEAFINCDAFEAFYGGAAGGGKTEALLQLALRYHKEPRYEGLLLRRTFPDLEKSLIPRSKRTFKAADSGAEYNETKKRWQFSSGAKVYFGYLERDDDVEQYQSAEFQFIGFDELTHFTRYQYTYLLSRARSSFGLRPFVRAASNPGSRGHAWVFARWAPWLQRPPGQPGHDPKYQGRYAASGDVLRYENDPSGDGDGRYCEDGTLSRTFIAAKLADNPYIDAGYRSVLQGLDPVRRAQLLGGDWLVTPAAGLFFRRDWFGEFVSAVPSGRCVTVRRWDLAGTEPHEKNPDPDWTSGVRLVKHENGLYYLTDIARCRANPGEVEAFVGQTMDLDGRNVRVRFAIDPAQAGKAQARDYVRRAVDKGLDAHASKESDPKEARIRRVSAAVTPPPGEKVGRMRIVFGPWASAFIQQAEAWPDVDHDDDLDALAGAYDDLATVTFNVAKPPPLATMNFDTMGIGIG